MGEAAAVSKLKGNGAAPVTRGELKPIKRDAASWKMDEVANNTFRAFVPADVRLEDLENPLLWTVVAVQLSPFDRVFVIREDRGFWAELLVLDARIGFAQVVVLRDLSPLPPLLQAGEGRGRPSGFEVLKDPRSQKYIAWRLSDRAVMNGDGSNSEEEAWRAIIDHASLRK